MLLHHFNGQPVDGQVVSQVQARVVLNRFERAAEGSEQARTALAEGRTQDYRAALGLLGMQERAELLGGSLAPDR